MVLFTSTFSTLLPLLPQLLDGDDLFTSTFSTLLLPFHNCCIWLILFTGTFSTLLPLLPQLLDRDNVFTSTFSTRLLLLPQLLDMDDLFTSTFSTTLLLLPRLLDRDGVVYQYLFYPTTTITTARITVFTVFVHIAICHICVIMPIFLQVPLPVNTHRQTAYAFMVIMIVILFIALREELLSIVNNHPAFVAFCMEYMMH